MRPLAATAALALSLVAAFAVWAQPEFAILGERDAAAVALAALVAALIGLRVRRSALGVTRLAAVAAATLGLLTSLAVVASAVYLTLRAFLSGGISLTL